MKIIEICSVVNCAEEDKQDLGKGKYLQIDISCPELKKYHCFCIEGEPEETEAIKEFCDVINSISMSDISSKNSQKPPMVVCSVLEKEADGITEFMASSISAKYLRLWKKTPPIDFDWSVLDVKKPTV